MLANGCRSPKYLLPRKPNIWPRKHSSCRFSVSSCSLSIDVDNIIVSSQFLLNSCSKSSSHRALPSLSGAPSMRTHPPNSSSLHRRATILLLLFGPPGDHPFLSSSRRRAPIHFFILRAAGRQSILSSFFAPPGANPFYLHSSHRGATIHILIASSTAASSAASINSCASRPFLHACGRCSLFFS